MVSKEIVSARATLASFAIGALALTGLGLGAPSTAVAQQAEASSAFGISATGVDPVGATPAVSSAGEVKAGAAGSEPIEIDTAWTIDTTTGLVVNERRRTWIAAAGSGGRTLVEERIRALAAED